MKLVYLSKMLLVSSILLIIISLLRLLSLSVWSSFTDMLNGFYSMFIYVIINRVINAYNTINNNNVNNNNNNNVNNIPLVIVNNAIFDNLLFSIHYLIRNTSSPIYQYRYLVEYLISMNY